MSRDRRWTGPYEPVRGASRPTPFARRRDAQRRGTATTARTASSRPPPGSYLRPRDESARLVSAIRKRWARDLVRTNLADLFAQGLSRIDDRVVVAAVDVVGQTVRPSDVQRASKYCQGQSRVMGKLVWESSL